MHAAAICLACRTAFPSPRPCDAGPDHVVVDLTTDEGRLRLVEETWGPLARRRRLRRLIGRGATGSPPAHMDDVPTAIGPVSTLRFVASFVEAISTTIADSLTEARILLRLVRCHGARSHGLSPKGVRPLYGVAEGQPARSPLCRRPCLAYAIALSTDRAVDRDADVLWREAAAPHDFDVRLDDGRLVRVPAGPLWFEADHPTARHADVVRAHDRLPVDLRGADRDLLYVPFDEALEEVVRPGDRVVLTADLRRVEDATAIRDSPRAPAPSVVVAAAPVVLRKM